MKKFNVGIAGYGWAASAHIPAINARSHGVTFAADRSAEPGKPVKLSELS